LGEDQFQRGGKISLDWQPETEEMDDNVMRMWHWLSHWERKDKEVVGDDRRGKQTVIRRLLKLEEKSYNGELFTGGRGGWGRYEQSRREENFN
jgi:hypothetical protein